MTSFILALLFAGPPPALQITCDCGNGPTPFYIVTSDNEAFALCDVIFADGLGDVTYGQQYR